MKEFKAVVEALFAEPSGGYGRFKTYSIPHFSRDQIEQKIGYGPAEIIASADKVFMRFKVAEGWAVINGQPGDDNIIEGASLQLWINAFFGHETAEPLS